MSDYTPSLDNLSLQYALSKDPGNGRTTEEWWAIRDAAQAEFDRAIAKVRTDAKAEALRALGIELNDRNKKSRTAPNMTPYQRGRADSYEAAYELAERRADNLAAS